MSESPTAVRSEADVRALVRDIVREMAPNPAGADDAGDEVPLVDTLEYTSLALLELAFTLEDEFELPPIDEETARRIVTILDVQQHVVDGLRKQGALAPA